MSPSEALEKVFQDSGLTKTALSEKLGVSNQVCGKAFRSPGISAARLSDYLNGMNYDLYAIPKTIHIEKLFDDVIKIDSDHNMEG